MGVVSIAESLAREATAFESGWTGAQLLDAAGEALGHAIGRYFSVSGTAIAYLGKGHNAGDALVALRILRDFYGWKIATRHAFPNASLSAITLAKWQQLGAAASWGTAPETDSLKRPLVLLDGLLGTGASGPLREPIASFAREMNFVRQQCGARIAAVDLPSGIDADTGEITTDTIHADITFLIGNAKRGLLHSRAADATGGLALVPVAPLTARVSTDLELISPQTLCCGKSPRPFSFHKGQAGRVAIVAGSASYTGAAVLAATGAMRGGGGLITLHVPQAIQALVSGKCPPEIIVQGYQDVREVLETRFDSLVIGCGLGKMADATGDAVVELISRANSPAVIDADALNLIAERKRTDLFTGKHLLTPHPGEFARLAPDLQDHTREEAARQFADRIPATLLLKGSRTLVTRRGEALHSNSTGTPGMATGGQGDLLSGVLGALLAAGDPPLDAACRGAWLCGRAAEIALQASHLSEESLTPEDVLHFLGAAFSDWRQATR